MLFADDTSSSAAWISVAIAAVVTIITGITARRSARDKMEFDAERVAMKTELAIIKTELTTVKADLVDCRKAHEECKEDHKENKERITALESKSPDLDTPLE